jgi:hypothetical protein
LTAVELPASEYTHLIGGNNSKNKPYPWKRYQSPNEYFLTYSQYLPLPATSKPTQQLTGLKLIQAFSFLTP